ncbi:uncharacterized protein DS421_13g403850 [Arachis hypogaea]|nr:uncharacterized protein DS421_13g403850 [Arachis hypogaea]
MASNNAYIVVLVYPNCRMRNDNNGVTFECENPILFRTQRVNTLSDLKSLILSKLGGDEHVRLMFDIHGRIMVEQVMELSAEVGHSGGGSSVHLTYVQDDRPLAPPPIHVVISVDEAEEGKEESDEDYVADSADSDSSDGGDEDECVLETPFQTVARHVLPPPHPILALSAVSSHYHSLDLDAMHERTPFSDTGEEDYNLDDNHRFRSREAVLQDENGCQWSLCVALRQNLGYWEIRRVGGVHNCLAPTMSQDHRQLDSSLICRVILPLIQSNPSVSIPILQGAVQTSYHFKPSYKKVWMAKQKAIAQIYGDWKESYNKVPKLLQALMFDKIFWAFPSCVKAFRHCKPFVSVDGTHLYGRYGGVLLIAVAQDENSNILPIAFAIVESESTESWSFFLTNMRCHVTPQDGLLVISDRSQAIKAMLSSDDSGWHHPRALHAYCITHMAVNFMTRFKLAEGKRYLINAAYSPSKAGYEWYMDALRRVFPSMVDWTGCFRKEIWLKHCDSGRRFGHMTTNLSECINAVLKETQYLSISAIVRITYERLQKLFVTKGMEV